MQHSNARVSCWLGRPVTSNPPGHPRKQWLEPWTAVPSGAVFFGRGRFFLWSAAIDRRTPKKRGDTYVTCRAIRRLTGLPPCRPTISNGRNQAVRTELVPRGGGSCWGDDCWHS